MSQMTDVLALDHTNLAWQLAVARQAAQLGQWPVCQDFFNRFRSTLMRHIVADEDSLFPTVAATRQAPVGSLLMMRIGQDEMTHIVQEMQPLLDNRQPAGFIQCAERLQALLRQHKARERAVVNRLADSVPVAQQAQLLTDMEGLFGVAA